MKNKIFVFYIILLNFFNAQELYSQVQYPTDSLKELACSEYHPERKLELYLQLSQEMLQFYNHEAIIFANKAYAIADSLKNIQAKATAAKYIGAGWRIFGNITKSIQYLYEAEQLISNKETSLYGDILRQIGETSRAAQNFETSFKYLFAALEIFENVKDTSGLAKTYNRLAATQFEVFIHNKFGNKLEDPVANYSVKSYSKQILEDTENAKQLNTLYEYISLATTYSKQKDLTQTLISTKIIESAYYSLIKENDKSLLLLDSIIEISKNENMLGDLPLALFHKANIYFQKKMYDKSIEIAHESFELAKTLHIHMYSMMTAGLISAIYIEMGRFEEAIAYLRHYYSEYEKYFSRDYELTISTIHYENQLEMKEKESKHEKIRMKYNFILISIFLFALIVILFINMLKNKQLKNLNDELFTKNIIISDQNEHLQHVNAEKNKLFSLIAHDLRSPFNAFLGLTEYMSENIEGMNKRDIEQIAREMRKSATTLFGLIENLLEWAMLQQNNITFSPSINNLLELAKDSNQILEESAQKKGIKINYNISPEILICTDINLLKTSFRNLTTNAIKFSHKNSEINIYAKNIDNNYIEIAINDEGIGMTEELINALYTSGNRVSKVGTEGEKGTGLGLLLCMGYAKKMGGQLRIESELNKGSTFYLTIQNQKI